MPSEVAEVPGEGVVGSVDGHKVIVGGDDFVAKRVGRDLEIGLCRRFRSQNRTRMSVRHQPPAIFTHQVVGDNLQSDRLLVSRNSHFIGSSTLLSAVWP